MNRLKFCIIIFMLSGCGKEVAKQMEETCSNPNISYLRDIDPIIKTACSIPTCHNNGFEFGDFSNFEELKATADDGQLWFLIGVTKAMPPSNSLDTLALRQIKEWIECGALDN